MSWKALDLFCGAGGASMGLHRAGFDVTGVDIVPQPRYPFRFVQDDALSYPLEGFDFIWASPPCQRYSVMMNCRPGLRFTYPDLLAPVRSRLNTSKTEWAIENVNGAPFERAIRLCGAMFGLKTYRHRFFETSFGILSPGHPAHRVKSGRAGYPKSGEFISVTGKCSKKEAAVLGCDWMCGHEAAESIPPAYSEFIGRQAIQYLESVANRK